MDQLLAWIKSEPAIFWTSSATAVIAAVQAEPFFDADIKNWVTLGITLIVGFVIRQGVSPTKAD